MTGTPAAPGWALHRLLMVAPRRRFNLCAESDLRSLRRGCNSRARSGGAGAAGAGAPSNRPPLPMTGGAGMAELTEKKRDRLKESTFGLPEERKYPMPDKSHARNAKARASQQEDKGTITAKEKAKIDRKADRILNK